MGICDLVISMADKGLRQITHKPEFVIVIKGWKNTITNSQLSVIWLKSLRTMDITRSQIPIYACVILKKKGGVGKWPDDDDTLAQNAARDAFARRRQSGCQGR
jgi:hypothetical protein